MSVKTRSGFISVAMLAMAVVTPLAAFAENEDAIHVQRLTWAGVKIVSGDTTLLIDAVGKDLWNGNAPGGLVPVEVDTRRVYALVTHAHNDHFDADTLKTVLGEKGYVIAHESEAAYMISRGLRVIPAEHWVPVARGGFVFTAVPASDGFGSDQVSWLVTKGDKRIFHGGDTLWHGGWPMVGDQFGGVDLAFLPINGVVTGSSQGLTTPAVMTPSQALDAAVLIRAQRVVPIHYGLNDPPYYVETPDPLGQFLELTKDRGIDVKPLKPGDEMTLD